MAVTELRLEGDKQLIKKLERLGSTIGRRVVRKAAGKSMTPMNKAAKREAPVVTGLLKKSIGKKVKTYRKDGVVWVAVGPRTGFLEVIDGVRKDPVKYAHLVEQHNPFMRRAFDNTKGAVLRIMEKELRSNIEAEARKP